jgi:hypothetical protein
MTSSESAPGRVVLGDVAGHGLGGLGHQLSMLTGHVACHVMVWHTLRRSLRRTSDARLDFT